MPVKVFCSQCGFLIHNSPTLQPISDLLTDVKECPSCGHTLNEPQQMVIEGNPISLSEKPKLKPNKENEKWWRKS